MLYVLALSTGFRRGELASLKVSDFVLGAKPPYVRLSAQAAKNRRSAHQPLPAALVPEIERWLAGRPREALAWPELTQATSKMVRVDLKAAGIEARDADGRVADFHALRHTFITRLARAGVMPQAAQQLARHSDVNLTMEFYTHLTDAERAAAIEQGVGSSWHVVGTKHMSPTAPVTNETCPDDAVGGDPQVAAGAGVCTPQHPTAPVTTEWAGPDSNRGRVDYEAESTDSESMEQQSVARQGPADDTLLAPNAADGPTGRGPAPPDRGRLRHARDRADAGLQPDLERALGALSSFGALAAQAMEGGAR